MRGTDKRTGELFSYVDLEKRVRPDHPLRLIRELADAALGALSSDFAALYSGIGRPSIAPEMLLRAMLLQAFYSIRSERQLMDRLEFDLLFRWFVGLGVDDPVWDHSTFSKNRDRLLDGAIAAKFLAAVLAQPRVKRLLSSDHFSVDGTLIEAWASMKSFKPKDGSGDPPPGGGRNRDADFHGEKRSNATHASTTDPEARLHRKGAGKEAKLCFMGHALMENRSGLLVSSCLTAADGHAERIAALAMIEPYGERSRSITLGADKGFDTQDFVNELRVDARHAARGAEHGGPTIGDRRAHHPASQATRRACASASGSRRPSAGSRRWPAFARAGSAASSGRAGLSPSRRPPTTSSACPGSWRCRHERPGWLQARRALADRRGRPVGPRLSRPLRPRHDDRRSRRTKARSPSAPCKPASISATAPRRVSFTWIGDDDMHEVSGDGFAEILDDGSIEITFAYDDGDEAILKAVRETSSTAC